MDSTRILDRLTQEFPQIARDQLERLAALFEAGALVPYVSRYRPQDVGELTERELATVRNQYLSFKRFESRKDSILKSLEDGGHLTDELRTAVAEAGSRNELEDLYLPFKPRKQSKGEAAREKGLGALASLLWEQKALPKPLMELAGDYVNAEKGVATAEEALEGAAAIIMETIEAQSDLRKWFRNLLWSEGTIAISAGNAKGKGKARHQEYVGFTSKLSEINSQQVLAIRKGEKEGALKWKFVYPEDKIQGKLAYLVTTRDADLDTWLKGVVANGFYKHLIPSIEQEARGQLKQTADDEIILGLCEHLRKTLFAPLAPPAKIMGIIPGLREGCRAVIIDEAGKLAAQETFFIPDGHAHGNDAAQQLVRVVQTHNVRVAVIGNGNGSRELERLLRTVRSQCPNQGLNILLMDETSARAYAASELSHDEHPNLDRDTAAALFLAMAYRNPLAELVKINPKTIQVGPFQHDVDQGWLKRSLEETIESCVCLAGVDVNTASYHTLAYVGGMGLEKAKEIMKYRLLNGPFKSREDLASKELLLPDMYRFCAGFLRVSGSTNPLDGTAVHPEHYPLVDRMAATAECTPAELIGNEEALENLDPEVLVTEEVSLSLVREVLNSLYEAGRDPREEGLLVEYRKDVTQLDHLVEGLILQGRVTNLTEFGAFVDIGLEQDGLVHVSELSRTFVKKPSEAVEPGHVCAVKVIGVDASRRRISLSIKQAESYQPSRKPEREERRSDKPRRSSGDGRDVRVATEKDILDQERAEKKKRKKKGGKSEPRPQDEAPSKTKFDNEDDMLSSLEQLRKHFQSQTK